MLVIICQKLNIESTVKEDGILILSKILLSQETEIAPHRPTRWLSCGHPPRDISSQIRPRTSQSGWFSPKYGFVYNVGHLGHTDSHAVLTFGSQVKLHSIS